MPPGLKHTLLFPAFHGAAAVSQIRMHVITFFSLLPDINWMRSRADSALSDIVATILIIILVVALAAIIAALILGIPLLPNKPVLAAFTADTVMGRGSSGTLNVPVIRLYQMAGDSLIQEFTSGTHSNINGTKVKIIDPAGKMYTVVTAISLYTKNIKKGEPYYVFRYNTGESNQYWLTNEPKRIFSAPNVTEPFSPSGKWQLIITEEKDTNMILYQKDLNL